MTFYNNNDNTTRSKTTTPFSCHPFWQNTSPEPLSKTISGGKFSISVNADSHTHTHTQAFGVLFFVTPGLKLWVCVCVYVCVRACVHACACLPACVPSLRACVRACARFFNYCYPFYIVFQLHTVTANPIELFARKKSSTTIFTCPSTKGVVKRSRTRPGEPSTFVPDKEITHIAFIISLTSHTESWTVVSGTSLRPSKSEGKKTSWEETSLAMEFLQGCYLNMRRRRL